MAEGKHKKYAQLIAQIGLNVQKGQAVFISAPVEQAKFVSMVVEECYLCGACAVYLEWYYQPIDFLSSKFRTIESLSKLQLGEKEKWDYKLSNSFCKLYLWSGENVHLEEKELLKMQKVKKLIYEQTINYRNALDNRYQSCIAAVPSESWATKIFPNEPSHIAIDKLWEVIFCITYVNDSDPIEKWKQNNLEIKNKCKQLNTLKISRLEYKNALGTNLSVGLLEQGRFLGGGQKTIQGVEYNSNIPSEEIFTSPKFSEVNGIVYSSKPLVYMGEVIDNFSLQFESGRVVDVKAEKGESLLKSLISFDKGASFLGECAIVPYNSRINNLNILFYNTLFDENTSCHLALGRGFKECNLNYSQYSEQELYNLGINESAIHVDFMIGTSDLTIEGFDKKGARIAIIKNGTWAL